MKFLISKIGDYFAEKENLSVKLPPNSLARVFTGELLFVIIEIHRRVFLLTVLPADQFYTHELHYVNPWSIFDAYVYLQGETRARSRARRRWFAASQKMASQSRDRRLYRKHIKINLFFSIFLSHI